MQPIHINDISLMAASVRQFVAKSGFYNRLAAVAALYLEFPDVGAMRDMERQLLRGLADTHFINPLEAVKYLDDETLRIDYGGIAIVLTCKQRFTAPSGRSVGYAGVAFDAAG